MLHSYMSGSLPFDSFQTATLLSWDRMHQHWDPMVSAISNFGILAYMTLRSFAIVERLYLERRIKQSVEVCLL